MGLITEACFALATGCLGHCTTIKNSPPIFESNIKRRMNYEMLPAAACSGRTDTTLAYMLTS